MPSRLLSDGSFTPTGAHFAVTTFSCSDGKLSSLSLLQRREIRSARAARVHSGIERDRHATPADQDRVRQRATAVGRIALIESYQGRRATVRENAIFKGLDLAKIEFTAGFADHERLAGGLLDESAIDQFLGNTQGDSHTTWPSTVRPGAP